MPSRIRTATEADLPVLQDIEVAAGALFRAAGMPEIANHPPPALPELADAEALLVAVDDADHPLGYAWVELVDGHAHLEQLSVHPDHGRRGVGTALLAAVVDWARGAGTPRSP